jgi:hypothetical protein
MRDAPELNFEVMCAQSRSPRHSDDDADADANPRVIGRSGRRRRAAPAKEIISEIYTMRNQREALRLT